MVQTRGSSGRLSASPGRPAGRRGAKPAATSTDGGGGEGDGHANGTFKAGKRRAASPAAAAAPAKKPAASAKLQTTADPQPTPVEAADSPPVATDPRPTPAKGAAPVTLLCQTPFEPSGQMYVGAHVSGAGEWWSLGVMGQ